MPSLRRRHFVGIVLLVSVLALAALRAQQGSPNKSGGAASGKSAASKQRWNRDQTLYAEFVDDEGLDATLDESSAGEVLQQELAEEISALRGRLTTGSTSGSFQFEDLTVRLGHFLRLPANGASYLGTAWMRQHISRTFSERARLKAVEDILASMSPMDATFGRPKVNEMVVDVGSGSGTYGLYAAVYGFNVLMIEPHPLCAHELRRAVTENEVTGTTTVVEAAVTQFDTDGAVENGFGIEVGLVCRGNERFFTPYSTTKGLMHRSEADDVLNRRMALVDGGDRAVELARFDLPLPLNSTARRRQLPRLSAERAALSDERLPVAVRTVRLDTLLRARNISRVALLAIDVDGYEPVVLSSALGLIREGRVHNIIVRFSAGLWQRFGYGDREGVGRFIADVCVSGHYYAARLPTGFFGHPLHEVLARDIGDGRILYNDVWFSKTPIDGAFRC